MSKQTRLEQVKEKAKETVEANKTALAAAGGAAASAIVVANRSVIEQQFFYFTKLLSQYVLAPTADATRRAYTSSKEAASRRPYSAGGTILAVFSGATAYTLWQRRNPDANLFQMMRNALPERPAFSWRQRKPADNADANKNTAETVSKGELEAKLAALQANQEQQAKEIAALTKQIADLKQQPATQPEATDDQRDLDGSFDMTTESHTADKPQPVDGAQKQADEKDATASQSSGGLLGNLFGGKRPTDSTSTAVQPPRADVPAPVPAPGQQL